MTFNVLLLFIPVLLADKGQQNVFKWNIYFPKKYEWIRFLNVIECKSSLFYMLGSLQLSTLSLILFFWIVECSIKNNYYDYRLQITP